MSEPRPWPAVDVWHTGDADLILAAVDDFSPTALEPRGDRVRLFFPTAAARDSACAALRAARYRAEALEVDDEDWARRSQENLKPVTIGRLVVAPPWSVEATAPQDPVADRRALSPARPRAIVVVIQPSMGFGTGHHATTRLCLRALQSVDLLDKIVVDVGTGSGILAIAAVRLGAARAVGIDSDADAIAAARENLALNAGTGAIDFRIADLAVADLPPADVVTANLTGALLARSTRFLWRLVGPGGLLIVSGFQKAERGDVLGALGDAGRAPAILWEQEEEGWIAATMKKA